MDSKIIFSIPIVVMLIVVMSLAISIIYFNNPWNLKLRDLIEIALSTGITLYAAIEAYSTYLIWNIERQRNQPNVYARITEYLVDPEFGITEKKVLLENVGGGVAWYGHVILSNPETEEMTEEQFVTLYPRAVTEFRIPDNIIHQGEIKTKLEYYHDQNKNRKADPWEGFLRVYPF